MRRIILASLFLFAIIILPQANFAHAERESACNEPWVLENRDSKIPEKYKVGIWLMDIGKIDAQSGSYELDFWVQITPESEDIDLTKNPPPELLFVNGRIEHITAENCRPHQFEYLVQGRFFNNLEYKDYPFQKFELVVKVESTTPGTYVILSNDESASGIDENVNVPGWKISDAVFDTVIHNYPEEGDFSRSVATFVIESYPIQSFLKNILPVILLVSISVIAFWIPKNYTPRIYITMPPLLALVFWHIGTLNTLPVLSYLTLFDIIMISAYAVLVNSILSLGIQMRLEQLEKYELVKKANKIMKYLIPVLGFGTFLILYLI